MRLEHPIFKGPLPAALQLEEAPAPEGYALWSSAGKAEPLQLWRVQRAEYPDCDYGLVSDPFGFEDSPDCEWISSGLNSKGPTAMALGRAGNLFMWGFAADPTQLSDSGRRVLVNTICYMARYDGVTPIVRAKRGERPGSSREWVRVYTRYVRTLGLAPESREWIEGLFDEPTRKATGMDPDKLDAWVVEHFDYLRPDPERGERTFAVDADCKTFGVGNRDPRFLPRLIERWKADPEDPLCAQLAARYAAAAKARSPSALHLWYETHKDHLFFSDRGGFQWMVAPEAAAARR